MHESAVERHDRLLAPVRERGTARASELDERLGISPVTARRDVELLAGKGLLDRVHHGRVSWPRRPDAPGGGHPDGARSSACRHDCGCGCGASSERTVPRRARAPDLHRSAWALPT
ncbi:DeoR family transcriptional regulator [Streptomyces sp. bgisy060]|uniref:DeoR family transcriptional regulator n=1 Tax=Streptomyces sp. bgisy060 TaxID=3413775 RepID=UPI003EB79C1E